MMRALSLTCLALALMAMGAGRAEAGKPTIAILGLEVSDAGGQPLQAQDVQIAKELTNDLRDRAKTGTGPMLAPNSDKELIDEKLLKNCDSEALACMIDIGKDVGGDQLLYGKLTKRPGGYNVSLTLLDVMHGVTKKSLPNFPVPLGTTGNDLLEKAKQMYAKITGEQTTGTLVVRLTTGDHGTILIDRIEKGSITAGTGQVTGLDEGKHKLRVEAEGYHPSEQDVTISSGGETKVTITLDKKETTGTIAVTKGPGETPPTPGNPPPGNVETSTSGSSGWRGAFIASTALTAASAGVLIYGYEETVKASNELCNGGAYNDVTAKPPVPIINSSCKTPAQAISNHSYLDPNSNQVREENQRGQNGHAETLAGGIGVGVLGAFAVVALYEGFFAKHEQYPAEHTSLLRKHRERFVVTPIASPTGAGVRIDW
jgi:hypothetical protein